MLKQCCQPTGTWFGLKRLPISHTENAAMGQHVQNHSFMASSPSSTETSFFSRKDCQKGRGARGEKCPPPPFSRWFGQRLLVSPGGKIFLSRWIREEEGEKTTWSRGPWSSLWGSPGPRRVVPWFGIKPLPAEGHQGTRGGCRPQTSIRCPPDALRFCAFGRSPRRRLGMPGGTVLGKKIRPKLLAGLCQFGGAAVLGRAGPYLGGFPSARHAERLPSSSACLLPDCDCLASGTSWLNHLEIFPQKFLLALWNCIWKLASVESCCGRLALIQNGNTGKCDIFRGWKCSLTPSSAGGMLEEFFSRYDPLLSPHSIPR